MAALVNDRLRWAGQISLGTQSPLWVESCPLQWLLGLALIQAGSAKSHPTRYEGVLLQ